MQLHKKLVTLTLTLLILISISASFAASVETYSLSWSFPILSPTYTILQNALDSIGQVLYFGSGQNFYPYNYLYAVNITNGQMIWNYDTIQPVNYISHFKYNNSDHIIVGIGGSTTIPLQSYVLAFRDSQNNATLWISPNLKSSVACVCSVESNVTDTEDVVAGLQNGTVVRLYGNSTGIATIEWQYNAIGVVQDIVQLNNGTVVVGTSDAIAPYEGHIYCLDKNGRLLWSYDSTSDDPLIPGLVKEFGGANNDGGPNVVAVFYNGSICVLSGTTGNGIAPWPFNTGAGNAVRDLLCTQDYTGDGFPDMVVSTQNGSLMIINGRTAKPVLSSTLLSSYVVAYIQYMYSYENGASYLNKTLAVSLENTTTSYVPLICGVNVTNFAVTGQIPTPGEVVAQNLFSVSNYTSTFTGDLLFTTNNVIYFLAGSNIITSEFPFPVTFIVLIIVVWLSIVILRRRR
jgi:hypothetical protein